MSDSYTELQRRLTVAEERNRANAERRNALYEKMKDEHNCNSLAELEDLLAKKESELTETQAVLEQTEQEARRAVEAVESALNITR